MEVLVCERHAHPIFAQFGSILADGDGAGTTGQLVVDLAVSLAHVDGGADVEDTNVRLKASAEPRISRVDT